MGDLCEVASGIFVILNGGFVCEMIVIFVILNGGFK